MAQVYRFTDENGQVRLFAEITPDPAFNGGTITQPLLVNAGTGSTEALTITSAAVGSDYENVLNASGADGASLAFSSDGSLSVVAKQTDATPLNIRKATGANVFLIDGNGVVKLIGLPTSDPHVSNQLWKNSGVLTVSAG